MDVIGHDHKRQGGAVVAYRLLTKGPDRPARRAEILEDALSSGSHQGQQIDLPRLRIPSLSQISGMGLIGLHGW